MSAQQINILNLYPRQMNMYGDSGNVQVLSQRSTWRGIETNIINFNPGDTAEKLEGVDLIIGGGGQDSGQLVVQEDLKRIAAELRQLIDDDAPALVICGTYQLFGNYFKTFEGREVRGIGIFDLYTQGYEERMIGNTVISSSSFGELIGYENHSGKTYLGEGLEPLGLVVSGCGNNGEDGTEGARYRNALGTYLHGPLLPKNPQIADSLIAAALARQAGSAVEAVELAPLPDTWVEPAREVAKSRPR